MDTVIMGNARLYEIAKEKDAIYAKEDFTDEEVWYHICCKTLLWKRLLKRYT